MFLNSTLECRYILNDIILFKNILRVSGCLTFFVMVNHQVNHVYCLTVFELVIFLGLIPLFIESHNSLIKIFNKFPMVSQFFSDTPKCRYVGLKQIFDLLQRGHASLYDKITDLGQRCLFIVCKIIVAPLIFS